VAKYVIRTDFEGKDGKKQLMTKDGRIIVLDKDEMDWFMSGTSPESGEYTFKDWTIELFQDKFSPIKHIDAMEWLGPEALRHLRTGEYAPGEETK
jgi:hypothetical protein